MPRKIKKYETKTLVHSTEDFNSDFVERELNDEGENGWELVSVSTITNWHEDYNSNSMRSYIDKSTSVYFFLKREKP